LTNKSSICYTLGKNGGKMTNTEIILKVITKAVANGWNDEQRITYQFDKFLKNMDRWLYNIIFSHEFAKSFWGNGYIKISDGSVWCDGQKIAKNLEELQESVNSVDDEQLRELKINGVTMISSFSYYEINPTIYINNWQYHLQQMVLEENPLKYLEKFL